jgi:hypothetical protein
MHAAKQARYPEERETHKRQTVQKNEWSPRKVWKKTDEYNAHFAECE